MVAGIGTRAADSGRKPAWKHSRVSQPARSGAVRLAWLLIPALSVAAGPASAQEPAGGQPSQMLFWGVDVAVATLSALFQGRSSETPLPRVILGGVAGGTVMYAGQRIVATRRPTLRLLGLETVAVGASVSRNIARRAAPLSDLTLPVFPFYVRVRSVGGSPRVTVRLSAIATTSMIRMATKTGRNLNLLESLYSGAAVFKRSGELTPCIGVGRSSCLERVGEHQFGAVTCSAGVDCEPTEIITHELEHVAQDVRDAVLFAVPASDYMLDHTGPAGRWISRYFVVDAILPLMLTNRIIHPGRFDSRCRSHVNFYECETEALLAR